MNKTTTAIELILPKNLYQALRQAARKNRRTESELILDAIQVYLRQLSKIDPLLGLFADEPDLLDRIVDDAMQSRDKRKLRLTEVTGC